MVCIYCSSRTQVVNSRALYAGIQTWRRRACKACKAVFTTRELPDLEQALRVRGHDDMLSPFSRDTLFLSIHASLTHRASPITDASGLCETIVSEILRSAQKGLIETTTLTRIAIETLARFDQAAATHYRAHHSGSQ